METIEHGALSSSPGAAGTTAMHETRSPRSAIRFRRFSLFPFERLLLCNGEPVDIGSRAFDLLFVLIRSPGSVVDKNTIVDFVWPSTIVEESNLRFQMASLRKALGPDRDVIKTIQGRGYLFAGETSSVADALGQQSLDDVARSEVVDLTLAVLGLDADRARAAVAVIDDDDDTREALDGLLRSSGFTAHSYPSVEAFVRRPAGSEPACLVLDVCMPGRTGLELQADLARAGVKVPIIFISGHADIHMSVRAMKAGAMEFLTKPVRHEELLDAIRGAVSRH